MNRSRWILALSFLGVILGGTLGFWLVEENWSLLDALYMTVISVTTVGYGEVHDLSTAGRVVAMVVLFAGLGVIGLVIQQVTSYAVDGALGGAIERRRAAKQARKLTGHTVLFGMGSRGRALARGLEKCVAIGKGTGRKTEDSGRYRETLVLKGEVEDEGIWSMVGVDRAANVLVAAGSDETNLRLAREIRRHLANANAGRTRVVAAIEEYATRDCFADRLSKEGVELIGLREQSLLKLAREMTINMIEGWDALPGRPTRVTVQVAGPALEEVLRVLAMVVQVGGDFKPEFTVHGCGREFVSSFKARFPEHERCCRILWEDGEFGEKGVADDEPDLAFFAMESNLRSFELAKRCLSRHPSMNPALVVACLPEGELTADLTEGGEAAPRVVSLYDDFLSRKDGVVSHAMEEDGRRIHEKYCEEANHEVDGWDELSEFHRDSNRLAALQQDIYRAVGNRFRDKMKEVDLVEYAAKCEHRRWMAFHLMAGYRLDKYEVERELRRKMKVHPDLVEYHELTEDGREKDRVNVRSAVGMSV